jgi:hypothetical protein
MINAKPFTRYRSILCMTIFMMGISLIRAEPPLVLFPAQNDTDDSLMQKPPVVAKNPILTPFEVAWNKNGYKDESGKIVLPAIYMWAFPFNDYGIAEVKLNEREYKTNKTEHEKRVEGQIYTIPNMSSGCFYINKKGEKIADAFMFDNGHDYPLCGGLVRITKNAKVGLMHISGKIIVPPQYTTVQLWNLTPSVALVGQGQKMYRGVATCGCADLRVGGTYGLINPQTGIEIAPVEFSSVSRCFIDPHGTVVTINPSDYGKDELKPYKVLYLLYKGEKAYTLYNNDKNHLSVRPIPQYDKPATNDTAKYHPLTSSAPITPQKHGHP